jgi:hypothetical protein
MEHKALKLKDLRSCAAIILNGNNTSEALVYHAELALGEVCPSFWCLLLGDNVV